MTNKEKYKEEILELVISDAHIGIDNETGELVACSSKTGCAWCKFYDGPESSCTKQRKEWFNEEYVEPKVDWSKVPVDAPILVSIDGVNWWNRYFASFDGNFVSAWDDGATSWSAQDNNITPWEYAKLAKSEENVE
jgi:hypothetical protein